MSKIILSPRGTVGCVAVAVAVAVADKAGGRLLGIVPLLSLLCLPGTFPLSVLALDAGSLSLLPELWFPSLRLPQRLNLSLLMCWVSERAWWVGPFVSIERGSSRDTGGPHIHCVAKEDPALLILLPQCRDYRLEAP